MTQYPQTASVSYPVQGLTIPYSAPSNQQLYVHSAHAYNGVSAENAIGLFHTVSNAHFKLFKLLAAGDVEATATIQAGSAVPIFTIVNNDGCLFQAKEKFNMIAFNISQAQTGSPVYTYKYYNGSAYATLDLLNTPSYSATGIQVAVFNAPIDWVPGDGTETGDDTLYSVQVIATTAPSQAVQINSLKIGKMLKYAGFVLEGGSVNLNFEQDPYLLQVGEAIVPFFSYTDSSNRIEIEYKIQP